jgi:3-oxoacyl-[acyl-carrier-protein] synthase-3
VGALDISAACSGFIYGLSVARSMIIANCYKNVLLVGAETLSKITDWNDRETCILFADGAGAAILQPCENGTSWMGPAFLAAKGAPEILSVPGGGSRQPATVESVERRDHFMKMQGREVFRFVVHRCIQMIKRELKRHSLTIRDIKYFIPHQANQRILDTIAQKFDIPKEKVFSNISHVGNTSSASVAIGLDELNREGLIQRGDLLMLLAFGAGLTWASTVIRW